MMKRIAMAGLRVWLPALIFMVFSVLLVISTVFEYHRFNRQLESNARSTVSEIISGFQASTEALLHQGEFTLVSNEVARASRLRNVRSVILLDQHQIVRYSNHQEWNDRSIDDLAIEVDMQILDATQTRLSSDIVSNKSGQSLLAYQPINLNINTLGIHKKEVGVLILEYDLSQQRNRLQADLIEQGLGIWATGMLSMLALQALLQFWLMRPLRNLLDTIARYAQGDLSAKSQITGHGEFAQLSAALNRMAAQLVENRSELQQTQENLDATLRSMGDGLIATDPQGNISRMNLVAERLTQWPLEEAIGKPIEEVLSLFDNTDQILIFGMVEKAIVGDPLHPVGHDILLASRSGLQYPISNSAAPIYSQNAELIGVVFVFRDISQEVALRREIEENESRFRAMFEQAAVGVAFVSPSSGKFLRVNARFAEITGYSIEEMLKITWLSMTHPEDLASNLMSRDQLLNRMVSDYEIEKRYIRKDGSVVWVSVTVSSTQNTAAASVMHIVVVQDITDRRLAQQSLQLVNDNLSRQKTVLDMISQGLSLAQIFDSYLRLVEHQYSGLRCSISLLKNETRSLQLIAAPSLPAFLKEKIDGLVVNDGDNVCGTAAYKTQRILVENIATNPLTAFMADAAKQAEIIACWTEPIVSHSGEVQGAFTVYLREPIVSSDVHLSLMTESTRLASLAIERLKADQDLRIAATAFEVDQGMLVMDGNYVTLRVNQAYCDISGWTMEEVVGEPLHWPPMGRQDAAFYEEIRHELSEHYRWQGEIWSRRKSGEKYLAWFNISAVVNASGVVTNFVASVADITKHMEAEKQIRQLAYFDPLTQLPNRRLLVDRLRQAMVAAGRSRHCGAVLFIDLDNFKTLNDTKGHDVGDLLLIEVSRRLLEAVRAEDTVSRLGGDEFVLILENLSEDRPAAAAYAEQVGIKILQTLGLPYYLEGHEHHSTPSIGISIFEPGEQKVEDLLKRADTAMYQSKSDGRNMLRFFDPAMQAALEARTNLEAELRFAISSDQLQLFYQAQVNQDREVLGAEVLLRWAHPTRGMISPVDFIPLAEETGLIVPIGIWVLQAACHQLKAWESHQSTQHLQLAVNVSARQFKQDDFAQQVIGIIQGSGIKPERLKLELTESLILENIDDVIEKMQKIRPLGVGFSMDDFGTGQSSLTYLKRLPLDQLKIDQSFVRDIATDPSDAVIVQTIIGMAHNLGLNVIAEGVEDESQLQFLTDNRCFAFQGYLFGKPEPLEIFSASLLRKN